MFNDKSPYIIRIEVIENGYKIMCVPTPTTVV